MKVMEDTECANEDEDRTNNKRDHSRRRGTHHALLQYRGLLEHLGNTEKIHRGAVIFIDLPVVELRIVLGIGWKQSVKKPVHTQADENKIDLGFPDGGKDGHRPEF